MAMVKSRVAFAALLALAASLWVGVTPAQAVAGLDEDGQYIFDQTNQYRLDNGRAPLQEDSDLNAIAQAYAQKMADDAAEDGWESAFKHNPNLASQMPDDTTYRGENVGWNNYNLYAGYDARKKMVKAWKESSGHSANMINKDFTHIGIGYVEDETGTWGVQVFAQYNWNTNYPELSLAGGGEFVAGETASVAIDVNYPIDANVEWWYRVDGGSWQKSSNKVEVVDGDGAKSVTVKDVREFRVRHLGVYSNIVEVMPDLPETTLTGGGDFFKGVAYTLDYTVDPAYTGKGRLWIKKNNRSWKKTDTRVYFTDGVGSKNVKPRATTTKYRVKVGGAFSNTVEFNRIIPDLDLALDEGDNGRHPRGEAFDLNIDVSPEYTGPVKLRIRKPGGSWSKLAMVNVVDGAGVFTHTQKRGKREYQIVFAGAKSNKVLTIRDESA